jgi:hypothetical protein
MRLKAILNDEGEFFTRSPSSSPAPPSRAVMPAQAGTPLSVRAVRHHIRSFTTVIPAKAGIQLSTASRAHSWTPAFAGVTA